jgi:hypothetical protein
MKPEKKFKKTELLKPVVPVISIDMPDWGVNETPMTCLVKVLIGSFTE